MKIRNGFVSNSSSSSFCIYGASLSDISDDLRRILEDLSYGTDGLEHYYMPYDDDDIVIGRSWSTVRDDETGAEFKQSTREKIASLCGHEVQCFTLEEAWYDG